MGSPAKARSKSDNLVVRGLPPAVFLTDLIATGARHLIQEDRPDFAECQERAEELERQAGASLIQFAEKALPDAQSAMEFTFHSLNGKDEAVRDLMKYVHGFSKLARRARQIEAIANELVLNAVLSAPNAFHDLFGGEYVFSPEYPCRLRVTMNDSAAVVSCWDPVGSLARDKVLNRLADIYSHPHAIEPSRSQLQSGIGCKIMMDNSSDFIAVCRQRKETLVACRIPLTGTSQEIDRVSKCFHLVIL